MGGAPRSTVWTRPLPTWPSRTEEVSRTGELATALSQRKVCKAGQEQATAYRLWIKGREGAEKMIQRDINTWRLNFQPIWSSVCECYVIYTEPLN